MPTASASTVSWLNSICPSCTSSPGWGTSDWLPALAPTLRQTDVFFPSIDEARLITGKNTPEEIASCMSGFGMKAFGIKLGKQGCFVTDFARTLYEPALEWMPVVDTTGAGDS